LEVHLPNCQRANSELAIVGNYCRQDKPKIKIPTKEQTRMRALPTEIKVNHTHRPPGVNGFNLEIVQYFWGAAKSPQSA
jgi:hypothetical protein